MFFNVSLLVYRDSGEELEVLVRYLASGDGVEACLPNEPLEPGEQRTNCVRRLLLHRMAIDLPPGHLRPEAVTIDQPGDARESRLFLMHPTTQFDWLARQNEVQGWRYVFVPFSSLEYVWVTPEIGVTREQLEHLVEGTSLTLIPHITPFSAEIVNP